MQIHILIAKKTIHVQHLSFYSTNPYRSKQCLRPTPSKESTEHALLPSPRGAGLVVKLPQKGRETEN